MSDLFCPFKIANLVSCKMCTIKKLCKQCDMLLRIPEQPVTIVNKCNANCPLNTDPLSLEMCICDKHKENIAIATLNAFEKSICNGFTITNVNCDEVMYCYRE